MPNSQTITPSPAATQQIAGYSVITRKDLRRHIAGSWGMGGLFTGVAHNGANLVQGASLLVDQSSDGLLDIAYDSDRFEHGWLYTINSDNSHESHRIASYSPTDGTISIGRTFENNPVTDVTAYEIHTHGVSPEDVNNAINWACQLGRQGIWVMLGGFVADGDMQDPGIGAWTGSGGTISKVVKTTGERILRVSSGYARSSSIGVISGRLYKTYAIVEPASNSPVSIVVWDETNNQAIDLNGNATNGGNKATASLSATWRAPDTCKSVHIRLGGAGDWSGAACYENASRGIILPEWCLPHDQVIVNLAWLEMSTSGPTYWTITAVPEPRGTWLEVEPGDWGGPIMARVAVPFALPADEAHEFPIGARDYLATGALRYIYTSLSRPKTTDTARFEATRVRVEREWQAYQRSRNPIAMRRYSWGRR